jgi:shikimate dehydrogenase
MKKALGKYAVIGDPVEHSLSPKIHNLFAKQHGIQIVYEKIRVTKGLFVAFVEDFFSNRGAGLNVTLPLKTEAFERADTLDEDSRSCQAVNTLKPLNGKLSGFNTDGVGFLADLETWHGIALKDKRILLLGSGGAAKGIVRPLLTRKPKTLVIANRTLASARALADQLNSENFIGLEGLSLDDAHLMKKRFDIIINATSAGHKNSEMPIDKDLLEDAICYDLSYGPAASFFRWADSRGAKRSIDGLGMLIEQAAKSYEIWTGFSPDTETVRAKIRNELGI